MTTYTAHTSGLPKLLQLIQEAARTLPMVSVRRADGLGAESRTTQEAA